MRSPIEGDPSIVFARAKSGIRSSRRTTITLVLATAFLACAACGTKGGSSSTAGPTAGMVSPTNGAVPAAVVDPSTVSSITGIVTLIGPPPAPRLIYMTAEPMCDRQHPTPVVSPEVVVGKDGALANAVVFIKSGLENYSFAAPKDAVHLSQIGCMYDPHVLALMVGQTLEVSNDDQTLHNVHMMAKINPSTNRGQAGGQPAIQESFSQEEFAIPIQCNIHPWMRSYAFVFKSPYFEVTPNSGKFELKNLPPGNYTIAAWQERYGTLEQRVALGANESKMISFAFDAGAAQAANR
jgi:plastocyanin